MYLSSTREGVVDSKIGKKGVLLSRRDNSPFIRKLYEAVVNKIFNGDTKEQVIDFVLDEMNKLFSNSFQSRDFVITKSIGDVNNMVVEEFTNEKKVLKGRVGNYVVPLLLKDKDERDKQLSKKDATNAEDFYKKSLPSQVQLSLKMESRGQTVQTGTRLEFLMVETENISDKASVKIESYDYFAQHKDVLKVDFMYYQKLLINPLDEMLKVAFGEKEFTMSQYKLRVQKYKMLKELISLYTPRIQYIDETCEISI